MRAHPILLQMKYARVVQLFAEQVGISLDTALDFFYRSVTSELVHEGVSDLHCMSDGYLADELEIEYLKRLDEY